jgi:hypothetical protein
LVNFVWGFFAYVGPNTFFYAFDIAVLHQMHGRTHWIGKNNKYLQLGTGVFKTKYRLNFSPQKLTNLVAGSAQPACILTIIVLTVCERAVDAVDGGVAWDGGSVAVRSGAGAKHGHGGRVRWRRRRRRVRAGGQHLPVRPRQGAGRDQRHAGGRHCQWWE